jgi:hypothetical protein
LRLQPSFEILNANLVFNCRVFDNNGNGRLPASDRIDPIVLPKHPKAVGYRFVERIRSHLDSMLTPPKIDARDAAIAKAHGRRITHFAFYSLAKGWKLKFIVRYSRIANSEHQSKPSLPC